MDTQTRSNMRRATVPTLFLALSVLTPNAFAGTVVTIPQDGVSPTLPASYVTMGPGIGSPKSPGHLAAADIAISRARAVASSAGAMEFHVGSEAQRAAPAHLGPGTGSVKSPSSAPAP